MRAYVHKEMKKQNNTINRRYNNLGKLFIVL